MRSSILKLALCFSLSFLVVAGLFALSQQKSHYDNGFYRLLPPHPVSRSKAIDLTFNSYYIAGTERDTVYLGNYTAPQHLLKVSLPNLDTTHIYLEVDENNIKFTRHTRVNAYPPYFYIMNGISPWLMRGKINGWKASRFMYDSAYFTEAVPVGTKTIAMNTMSTKTRQRVLGLQKDVDPYIIIHPEILQKQIDGVFCTDGKLIYNKDISKLIYTYNYRNEYLVMDSTMKLLYRGNTIDTTTMAKITAGSLYGGKTKMLSSPPYLVNINQASAGDKLYVHSNLMAKNDLPETFKRASVIDVYNLNDKTYEFSFYLYPYKGAKLSNFQITGNYLIAVQGKYLVLYEIIPQLEAQTISR